MKCTFNIITVSNAELDTLFLLMICIAEQGEENGCSLMIGVTNSSKWSVSKQFYLKGTVSRKITGVKSGINR